MILRRDHHSPCSGWASAAFTFTEMMVAMALGTILMTVVAVTTVYSARSFVGMGSYADLERASSKALDTMSREIRQSRRLVSFSTNRLELVGVNGSTIIYAYDPQARTLSEIKAGNRTVLLEQCDTLTFHISQRNPMNNFQFYDAPANRPDLAKLIDVSWRCSRTMFGEQMHTESVQTAKIVIRN